MPRATATFRFVKLTKNAFPPSKDYGTVAGYDLKSAYDVVVPPRGKELVKTDIKIQMPKGCYGRITPHDIDVGAGVVDLDYRGNVGVVLFNHSDKPFHVQRGDRIAQLICEQIFYLLEEVQEHEVLPTRQVHNPSLWYLDQEAYLDQIFCPFSRRSSQTRGLGVKMVEYVLDSSPTDKHLEPRMRGLVLEPEDTDRGSDGFGSTGTK